MAIAIFPLLGGCGTPNGDFGEVQPCLVSERAANHMQGLIARYCGPAPTWMREQNLATVR
ncbi:MAG TPA: hypothetical protein VLN61_11095 [Pseudolabrys sp.]|nr:hypothetical protein [Pseudolabrys sp.]